MKITVILCTYNRCRSLAKTLASVAASALPESVKWEVLVVDNNSSDQTRDVVEDFCRRFPGRIRYLFESQQGKSHALNSGVREARGDVLAFIDDDVTVEPTWLQNLTAVLDNNGSGWAGTGGRTLLAQAFSPPPWLGFKEPYNLGGVLAAHFDLGNKPLQLNRAPFGTNMAFRKKMFEKYGLFRTDLGPSPDNKIPRPNEDTEFGRRLMAAGQRLRYEPSAIVYHPVPESRVRKEYFLAWWFDYGRADVREWAHKPDILGIPRRFFNLLKIGIGLPQRILRWLLDFRAEHRFFKKCYVWMTAGQMQEIWRQLCHKRGRRSKEEDREKKTPQPCSLTAGNWEEKQP